MDEYEELVLSLEPDVLLEVINTYCDIRDYDDQVYVNDEDFFETFFDNDPVGLVHKIVFGSFNYYDPYVYFDAYNNLATIKDLKEFFKDHYDIHDVADCISENPEYFDFLNL